MPQLKCLAACGPSDAPFEAGRTYHFDEEVAARVMRGSPSSWEIVEGVVRVGGPDERDYVDYRAPAREAGAEKTPPPPPSPSRGEGAGGDDEGPNLDELSVPDLRAFAAAQAIDLTGLRSKLDIRNAIERELSLREETEGAPGDDVDDDAAAGDGDDDPQYFADEECTEPVETPEAGTRAWLDLGDGAGVWGSFDAEGEFIEDDDQQDDEDDDAGNDGDDGGDGGSAG